ncbi:hypothetical protein [Kineosporia sp. NBRC 101731]|uniref:hypothetical protein n=1 Tax=Kineosporia sp. NBRC 101731 TaxID=3032199 RepID=UPI0024A399DF|nr:hypothetical protein [Kineosporia sp. NBRC 101731]GLY31599.1 hypothetical protein Kisp02_49640 [Kineosporia sp. NBRC 101731]
MPGEVLPYLVPTRDTVSWGSWELGEDESWVPLPAELEGWDPGTDLFVRRSVKVDVLAFVKETALAPSHVRVTASWTSSTTDMTDACSPVLLNADGHAYLHFKMDGKRIAGVLTLRTTLTLAHPPQTSQLGVARIPGSVLAQDQRQVSLDGTPSMFPVHEVDFSGTPLPPEASWHLETTTDLDAPFYGTFQLLLNSRDKELSTAVRNPKDKRQKALCDELQAGIAALMLELAVRERDDLLDRTWPSDSVGEVLSRLLINSDLVKDVYPDSAGMSRFRSRIAQAVRRSGQGRQFT